MSSSDWKQRLRPASFRGVPFFIDTSSFSTGRKVALHEFPDRDLPYPEDIGKIPRTFKLEAHILGDDYFQQKENLILAFEKEGIGELVHPYYGTVQVQAGAISINEDTGVGRIASLSVQFYNAGDNRFPQNVQDKVSVLDERAGVVIAKSKEDFDSKLSIEGLPGYAVQSARDKISQIADTFTASTQGLVTVSEEVSKLAFNSRNLVAETDTLLQSPEVLSSRLLDSFSLLENSIPSSSDKSSIIGKFTSIDKDDEVISQVTETRKKQQANTNTLNTFIRQVAIANAAQYAVDTEFDNINEANSRREEISELIYNELENTDNDDIYQAMLDLNAVLVRAVPDLDNDIPNIENFTPKKTTNSLVVAYDLFENLESEEDLIKRNKIKNPAIIEEGVELEVINVRRS